MKLKLTFLLSVAFVAGVAAKAQAANFFTYNPNEQELYHSTFDNAEDWQLNNTTVAQGELQANPETNWASAYYDLSSLNQLDLDEGDVALYWSARTDRSKPELGKFFMELNVVATDTQEPRQINWNIRPISPRDGNFRNLPYLLYVDPGFQIPHEVEQELVVPDQFPDTETYESFRLTLSKTGVDTVEVTPYYWLNDNWQAFSAKDGSTLPMSVSIQDNLEGQDYFESLSFRFRQNRSYLDAVAITRIPTDAEPVDIPEASTALGLFAMGAWGIRKFMQKLNR